MNKRYILNYIKEFIYIGKIWKIYGNEHIYIMDFFDVFS